MESGKGMKLIKNLIVAFSLYSQIPMPRFEWTNDDMKHNVIFLPWVGIVIGLISWGLYYLFGLVELPLICKVALYTVVPLIVTGGFHVDGYMDVQDALRSYKSPEEKLQILKDPHIGAFAIIRLAMLGLAWMGALAALVSQDSVSYIHGYFAIFFIARALAGISNLGLGHAKKTGMLQMETGNSTRIDMIMCILQLGIGIAFMLWLEWVAGVAVALVSGVFFLYYRQMCYKQFGGVTGDTSGYSIVSLERWLLVTLAVISYIPWEAL